MEIPEEEKKMSTEEKKGSVFSKDSIKAAFKRETYMGSFGRGLTKRPKPAVLQEVYINIPEVGQSGTAHFPSAPSFLKYPPIPAYALMNTSCVFCVRYI